MGGLTGSHTALPWAPMLGILELLGTCQALLLALWFPQVHPGTYPSEGAAVAEQAGATGRSMGTLGLRSAKGQRGQV